MTHEEAVEECKRLDTYSGDRPIAALLLLRCQTDVASPAERASRVGGVSLRQKLGPRPSLPVNRRRRVFPTHTGEETKATAPAERPASGRAPRPARPNASAAPRSINAEGELQAAEKLSDPAGIISRNPATLQLRYLQTLGDIRTNHNSTVVFPLPLDLVKPLLGEVAGHVGGPGGPASTATPAPREDGGAANNDR